MINEDKTVDNNMKLLLRRYEDDLYAGGLGVVIMGVWNAVKAIMGIIINFSDIIGPRAGDSTVFSLDFGILIASIILVMFLLIKAHLYIGLNAARAARGKKYKKGYFTGAIILLVLSTLGLASYGFVINDMDNIFTVLASILVDLTTIYIFAIVIRATIKIRELKSAQIQE